MIGATSSRIPLRSMRATLANPECEIYLAQPVGRVRRAAQNDGKSRACPRAVTRRFRETAGYGACEFGETSKLAETRPTRPTALRPC